MAKKSALEEAMKKATAAIEQRNAQPIKAKNDIVQNRLNSAMNQATRAINARAAKEQTTERMQTAPRAVTPTESTIGRYGAGNIDLYNRPKYKNDDGSVSTVKSISIGEDGKEILIPTVVFGNDGSAKLLTDEEAIQHYHNTGEYLGKFSSVDEANKYAEELHKEQAKIYSLPNGWGFDVEEQSKEKTHALEQAMQSGTADYLTDAIVESDAQFADYANSGMRLWQADLAKKRNELSASGLAGTEELKWLDDEVEKLTPQERRVFYYIYGVDGASAARAYAEDPKKQQKWYKDAREGRARLADYEELRGADDFAEKSQYKTTYQPGTEHFNAISGTYDNTGYGDLYYDYINKDERAIDRYDLQATQTNFQVMGLDMGERKELYDEEIALYNYLYALDEEAGDKNHTRANDYIKLLTSELNAREREKAREYWVREAREHPVLSSAFSVVTAPMKVVGYVGQTMDYLSGVPLDPNEGYNRHSHINKDIRETVSETIANSGAWGPVGSFLYNTGMSMADFLYTNAITGGGSVGSKLALSIMGTSTAADTVIDAKERGLSDDQAFTLGTIAGAAEIITERFSIDALFKGDWEKSALKYILKNGLTEGSEEVAADLINNIADILISKSQSEWQKAIDAYVANGEREDKAFILALTDQAKQMGLSFVGGFISGGVSSGGRVVVGKVGNLISQKANVTKKEQGAATLHISPEEQVREAVERRNAEIRNTQVQAQQPGAQAQGQTVQPVSPQEMVQRAMQARTARNETRRTGILAGAKESDIRAGEILSDVFGRRVVFFDKAPTADGIENGFYDAATGTIHINVRSENVFAQIFSHELTHSIEKSRAYQNFSRAVLQQIGKTGDIVAMRKEIARIYARNGQALQSEAAIDRELVAKYVEEHLLTNEESIMRLAQQNRTIAQRIKHWIDTAIAALGNADAKERAFLYRAQALYAKALKQTKMQAQGITAKERLGYLRADFNAGLLTQEEFDNELEEIMAEDDWETVYDTNEEKNEVENTEQYSYNKNGLIGKTFPPYNVSHSDANERAIRWARNEKVKDGWRKLFSYHGSWYVVEADKESDVGYKIIEKISEKQYDYFAKEFEKYDKSEQRLSRSTNEIDLLNQRRGADGHGRQSAYDETVGHGGKDFKIQRLGQEQNGWRNAESERYGNLRSGNRNSQRLESDGVTNEKSPKKQFSISQNNGTEQKAIDVFGTTKDFSEAGYVLSDGTMLKFTDESHKGERIYDHRAIGKIFGIDVDLNVNHGFNKESNEFLDEFVEDGAIRIDVGDPSLDMDIGLQISSRVPLTKAQEKNIRELIEWKKTRENEFEANLTEEDFLYNGPLAVRIDIGGDASYAPGAVSQKDLSAWGKQSLEYKGKYINADKIIEDIRHYYKTGETRNRSAVAEFHYSFSPAQKKTAEEQRAAVEWLQENLEKGEIPSARAELDSKATNVLNSAEAKLTRTIAKAFGIRGNEARQTLRQYAADLAEEYLYFGMVSEHTMQQMFDTVWQTATRDNSEFIAQYEEVKAYLNKNGVSISEDIKAEIPDYNEWRKAQMGKLKISKDALPVDVLYQTLSDIAPEQFPPDVNAPTDQLMLMSEMADKLVKREEFLHDMSGRDADEIKRITELDFRACVEDFENEIFKVKKYRDAQSKETVKRREQEEELAPKTTDEVLSMYDEMKKARKVYERVAAKQLLTPNEQMTVGQLLRGQASLKDLDPNDPRSAAIESVYEARAEFEKYAESVRAYNSIRRQKLYSQADKYLRNMNSWEDKAAGILYARETMERNVADITKNVPEDGEAINKAYFAKVHKNEANATRGKNEYRNRVAAMNLSRKAKDGEVSEAAAVQIIGEAQDAMRRINNSNGRVKYVDGKTYEDWKAMIDAVWESSPSIDQAKVQTAVNEFRKIYDELFAMMNDARVKNGYEPVDYRSGYFPHFKADTLNTFAKALGIQTDVTELPTTIAGLTHTFKPGIRFIPNALQRKGVNTTYDAVEGFDRYIEGVMDVIHHTEDIQRLRALASRIRYWASDKGIQEKHDEINKRDDLNDDQKKALIDDLYKNAPYRLSNFVQTLDEYTNLLANKKSAHDRQTESDIGRRMYNVVKALEGRIAANMVAVNPGSWLTNFIPLTQAWGVVDSKYMLGGMWQTLKAYKNSDGITERSDFLTNRRGSDAIAKTTMQKVSSAASAGMEIIDNFVADSIVRARYEQNLKRGLSEEAALEEADALAASVMADRSKGALPTVFGRKNPATKLLTQFQVEVNNQLSFLFKDLPREKREEGIGKLVWALLKYAIGAYIYNNIYEAIVGRRPALDPIGILNDTVGDFTGYELPSLIDVVGSIDDIARGDETLGDQFKAEKKSAAKAMAGLGENVLQEVPFVGGLLGGGRLPISSALPSIKNLVNAIDWTNEQSGKKRAVTIATEIAKPLLYLAPPFGGGQAKKLAEGVATIIQGGSYKRNNEGERTLQYPVKRNVGEIAQTALFGKSATSGARTWVESGFASLTAGQTKAYQKMVDLGEDEYKVYDFMRKLSKTEKSKQYSKQIEQIRTISKSKFSEKAKQEAVRSLFGTSESGVKARKKFDKLVKAGLEVEDYLRLKEEDCVDRFEKYAVSGNVSRDAAVKIARDLEEAENANGDEKDLSNNDRYRIIFDGKYSTKDTEEALRATMDEKTQNKVDAMNEYGVDCTLWADYKLTYSVMYPNDKESGERAENVLRKMDLTKDQRAAIYQAVTRNKEENNPFGSKVAKSVEDAIKQAEE